MILLCEFHHINYDGSIIVFRNLVKFVLIFFLQWSTVRMWIR